MNSLRTTRASGFLQPINNHQTIGFQRDLAYEDRGVIKPESPYSRSASRFGSTQRGPIRQNNENYHPGLKLSGRGTVGSFNYESAVKRNTEIRAIDLNSTKRLEIGNSSKVEMWEGSVAPGLELEDQMIEDCFKKLGILMMENSALRMQIKSVDSLIEEELELHHNRADVAPPVERLITEESDIVIREVPRSGVVDS